LVTRNSKKPMYEISEIQSVDITIFDFDDLKSHKILYDFDLKIWIISYESYGPPFCLFFGTQQLVVTVKKEIRLNGNDISVIE